MGDTNHESDEAVRGKRGVGRRGLLRSIAGAGTVGLLGSSAISGTAVAQSDVPKPENLRVAETTHTSATVEWDRPSEGADAVDHYEVTYSGDTDAGASGTVGVAMPSPVVAETTDTTAEVAPLVAGFDGVVSVAAVGPDGATSGEADVDVQLPSPTGESPPPAPSDLKLRHAERDGHARLAWDAVDAADLSHYELDWVNVYSSSAPRPHVRTAVDGDSTEAPITGRTRPSFRAVDEGGNRSPAREVRYEPHTMFDRQVAPYAASDVESAEIEVVDRDAPLANEATVREPADDGTTYAVSGTVAVPSGCYRPTVSAQHNGEVLRVRIGVERRPDAGACVQTVQGVEYEAGIDCDEARAVEVTYVGSEYRTVFGDLGGSPPPRPTGLEVTPTGPNTATASWDPVGHEDLSHYVVWPIEAEDSDDLGGGPTGVVLPAEESETAPDHPEQLQFAYQLPDPGPWYSIAWLETSAAMADLDASEYTVLVQAVNNHGFRSPWAAADLTLTDSPGEEPAPIDGATPTDPDDDGLYEDLNGNGEVDYADVVTYFEHMDEPAMQNSVAAYDYNGNGDVDYADLVDLFGQV
ncbi:fibronectin type III domain-containing protein [Halomicrobium salinisoli]|uniref:fibronectin type III domain-containing protein n=1 Tax=Halomicrobium salinisoli TaxID=2878391 RepID=UPI001CF03722|nr:fibronectin type III domain-containing protein [Halomicrobium salinisoli]